jgi:PAS domain-containing protein
VLLHSDRHTVAEAAATVVVAAGATAVPARHRRMAASTASVALLLVTAVLVHLSGGLIEAHFLFFVIVAAVTLYQQWAPFLSAVVFVIVHHGVVGTLAPASTYNHPAAVENPWMWAGVHGGFIALASAVGLAAWRFDELVRDELVQVGAHSRVVLDSVGDAVIALDAQGVILSTNAAASVLLRRPPQDLVGQQVHQALHSQAHPIGTCPLGPLPGADATFGVDAVTAPDDGALVPVRYQVSVVRADGPAAAVLTLTDLSSEHRAHVAEEQLHHLSAERLAERAEVEQLVASVRPKPLDVEGLEVAATYLPASGALVGGDLYDWFVAPDGSVHVTVIDAMGKGLAATNQAVAVLHALRLLVLDGVPLEDVIGRADALLLRHDPELMASVVMARLNRTTGRFVAVSAGHPPALVVRSAPAAEYLATEGLGIGCPGAGSTRAAEAVLEPGDTLVLYTDGLIEGLKDPGAGLDDVRTTACHLAGRPLRELTAALAREPRSVSADDDRVVVAVRRQSAGGTAAAAVAV